MAELKRPLTKESPTVSDSSVEPLATDPASAGSRVARAPGIVTSLLEQLYRQEIAYCRWQGNEPWQSDRAVPQGLEIGRASCRERGESWVEAGATQKKPIHGKTTRGS